MLLTINRCSPTLLDALKTEEVSWPVRREALRVVGIVGALDPLKFKQFQNESLAATTSAAVDPGARDSSIDSGLGAVRLQSSLVRIGAAERILAQSSGSPLEFTASSDDYYPTVAIDALMKIMGKPSLSQHHSMVIQAVMFIFKSLGMQGIPFLSQIIPPFLSAMRTSTDESLRETLFQQIGMRRFAHAIVETRSKANRRSCIHCTATHSELFGLDFSDNLRMLDGGQALTRVKPADV